MGSRWEGEAFSVLGTGQALLLLPERGALGDTVGLGIRALTF